MKALGLFFASSLLVACASNPNKVQNIETKMEKTQTVSAGYNLGVKDDVMVVQKKASVAEELRRLQYEVHTLEDRTYGGERYFGNPGAWGALNKCRMELASVDTGGTGKMNYIEPLEYVVPEEEFTKIGVDESGELVSVTEEGLKDRIDHYQKYRKTLMERNRILTDKMNMCQLDLQAQKRKLEKEEKRGTFVSAPGDSSSGD